MSNVIQIWTFFAHNEIYILLLYAYIFLFLVEINYDNVLFDCQALGVKMLKFYAFLTIKWSIYFFRFWKILWILFI